MPVTTVENAFSFCSLDEKHIKAEEKNQQILELSVRSLLFTYLFFNNISFHQGVEWVGVKLSLTLS